MRSISLNFLCVAVLALGSAATASAQDFDAYPKLHAYNEFGDAPLYGPDFTQLEYLNAAAPVGGDATRAFSVVWQTFNPFGTGLGQPAPGIRANTYDTLMSSTADELFTAYVYMAEYYQIAEDRSWMLFKIRDEAAWWDGSPITARDVQFTAEKQSTEGFPGLISSVYDKIEAVEVIDDRRVLFRFTPEGAADREMPFRAGSIEILPEAYWADKSLNETLLTPPLGSGPYEVTDFAMGESLTYSRVADYWGLDHPLNKGSLLTQTTVYDTIREREAQKIAFLARDLQQFTENVMERWINGYDAQLPLIEAGVLKKEKIESPGLQGAQMAFFNLRNPKFQDARVRRALAMAFDFETMNEQFFFGEYRRNNSYYINHEPLNAKGEPEGIELALLEKHAAALSAEDLAANMAEPWVNPVGFGGGDNFDQLDAALALFEEAGYTIDGDKLLDPQGAPYEILIEFYSPSFERIWQTYRDSLEQLGITVELKLIDQGVWFENLRTRKFEMISFSFQGSRTPGTDFKAYFSTEFTNTPNSYGFAGVEDPFIDALVVEAQETEDLETLEAIGRLVDRHMRNKNYNILFWHYPYIRLLHWDLYGKPSDLGIRGPREAAATAGWWYDEVKVDGLENRIDEVVN